MLSSKYSHKNDGNYYWTRIIIHQKPIEKESLNHKEKHCLVFLYTNYYWLLWDAVFVDNGDGGGGRCGWKSGPIRMY